MIRINDDYYIDTDGEMSTITDLIARLRSFAKLSEAMEKRVGQKKGDLTKILFEAADTIEALRMKLSAYLLEQDTLHGGWIPCNEKLPDDLTAVNITWVNRDPEPYYESIKDKPFTATAIHYNGKWFWWSCTCEDILKEYGKNDIDEINDGIEVIAWRRLPEPYKGKTGKEGKDNG